MNWRFLIMGESALLAEPDADPLTANAVVHAVAAELERMALPGLQRPVPGAASLLVLFDARHLGHAHAERVLLDAASRASELHAGQTRLHTIGVRYGGADGPDLPDVAAALGCTEAEIVARHCAPTYRVLLLGFAPGFPYLGPLPAALRLPRRAKPRVSVPAGSVAIAAEYSGIYPAVLPGGWHLVGRCATPLFAVDAEPPALLLPGDNVRFEPLPGGVLP